MNKHAVVRSDFSDLIMFDRGYGSRFLMFLLNFHKKHFLMRVQGNFITEVNTIMNNGEVDAIITIKTYGDDKKLNHNFREHLADLSKESTLQVRVLIFTLNSGIKEIIVTSLIDQSVFTTQDIFELYAKRWNVEEGYKLTKTIAEMENFSGKSTVAIEQDFFATILVCNMTILLMNEAQDELNTTTNNL